MRILLATLSLAATASLSHAADMPTPKLSPDAIPLTADHAYLKTADAPDYWALSPYYIPQQTSSACSLASITMAVNFVRGLPPLATDKLATQNGVLDAVGSDLWRKQAAEGGDGVKFAELATNTEAALRAFGLSVKVEAHQPDTDDAAAVDAFRSLLKANEASADDMILVYFNQGVATGDWDGPHVSPIGAYDAATDRVLIMDVDREWYVPYWTKTEVLFHALRKPAPADQGSLAGEVGGWVHVTHVKPN